MIWYLTAWVVIVSCFLIAVMLGIGRHARGFCAVHEWMKLQDEVNRLLAADLKTQAKAITQLSDEITTHQHHEIKGGCDELHFTT